MKKIKECKNLKRLNYLAVLFLVLCMGMFFNYKTVYANELDQTKTGYKESEGHELKVKVDDNIQQRNKTYAAGYDWGKYGSRYYYNQLNSAEKNLYNQLYNRCMELLNNSNINCNDAIEGQNIIGKIVYDKSISNDRLKGVFDVFEAENPQFFFISTQYWYGNTTRNEKYIGIVVYPRYVSGSYRGTSANAFKDRLETWIKTAKEKKTEMQILRRFEILLDKSTKYKKNELDQSAISAVLDGQTVCAGYAKTYTMLCNAVGNESVCVTGSGHEWSRVRIGNKWYNVDATWDDDDERNVTGMQYFLVSDASTKVNNVSHELYPVWNEIVKAPKSNDNFLDPIFNCYYYRNRQPDLKKAFGYVDGLYLDHFMQSGVEEGRRASDTFDVNFYKNNYSDLRNAYGNDLPKYYQHYAQYGVNENRQGADPNDIQDSAYKSTYNGVDYSLVYDYDYYISHNPDVKAKFGANVKKAIKHFVEYGMNEGRRGNETFDVNAYRRAHQDLRIAFGKDLKKYYIHYIEHGQFEKGRCINNCDKIIDPVHVYNGVDYSLVYDYDYYISHNPDVKNKFGEDDIAVLKHFVEYGMNEGRQGNATFNVKFYKNANNDLIRAYGNDMAKYYMHYINYGHNEGRKGA